jgi:hypothetical protein
MMAQATAIGLMLIGGLLAAACLLFPQRLQSFAVRYTIPALKHYVESSNYILNVTFVGVLGALMFILMLWILISK